MEFTVGSRYINLPVKNDAEKRLMRFLVDGRRVREFEIELAEGEPDLWVFADVSDYGGQQLTIEAEGMDADAEALQAIEQSDDIKGGKELYAEELRPQFHFSSRRGWINDPNGLMYYDGEYHLFYQHNPYGWRWGNMHWGHAVSRDLVHWEEQPDALYPDEQGTMFSGSGVVDNGNTAGFRTGEEEALVCVYTAAGGTSAMSNDQPFTQAIAYSNDRGMTWSKYVSNPVLGHVAGRNRDPKVIWHEPTRKWVMALFLDQNAYALYSSPDLKDWTKTCDLELPGCGECPDMFELPVDGNAANTRWVFWGANGSYLLGSFDGEVFEPEGELQRFDWGGNSYAAQSWSDIPAEDGRRIQIAWGRVELPGMPFNQQMTFPCELTLRKTGDGVLLHAEPVKEIEALHAVTHSWRSEELEPGLDLLSGTEGELFDLRAEIEVGDAEALELVVRGVPIVYDVKGQSLSCQQAKANLKPADGKLRLQVLVDRTFVEVFGNGGRVYLPVGAALDGGNRKLELLCRGGRARVISLEVSELRSVW